jgi:hypothetical protein
MKTWLPALLMLFLAMLGCTAHDPPRCSGPLELINPAQHPQTAPDSHGR